MRGHKYTDEEFLKIVRDTLTKHGSVPKKLHYIYIIGEKRYGSWEKAVLAATGKPLANHNWTDAELLDFIRKAYNETKTIPSSNLLLFKNNSAYQEIHLRFQSIDDANEKAIGTSLRLEIFKSIEKLTPPGCSIATTREIFAHLKTLKVNTTTYSIGRMCRNYQTDGLLAGKRFGRNTLWQLTDKGRQWLKSKNQKSTK